MDPMYIEVEGDIISYSELQFPKARETTAAVQHAIYTSLVECRRNDSGEEIVVFDAEVELAQRRVCDIRRVERVALVFRDGGETRLPDVLALRSDFPKVPHLNIRDQEYPRSLCIFDDPPEEVRLHWSAPRVVERIRQWLALTAKGTLHTDDQPLEPLLPGSLYQLVVPHDLFTAVTGSEILVVDKPIDSGQGRKTLIATRVEEKKTQPNGFGCVVTPIVAQPQPHGIIAAVPKNLSELHDFLSVGGVDLLGELRTRLKIWKGQSSSVVEATLIFIVWLPKQRDATALPETSDLRAFLTTIPIRKIGGEIGIWGDVDGALGDLISPDETKTGQQVPLTLLNPHWAFSREQAVEVSGFEVEHEMKLVLVGVGALGSQIFMNLVRMGYGQWTLIDDDFLLPHNLGRHALTETFIGFPKAPALAFVANGMLGGEPVAHGVVANVLDTSDETAKAFAEAHMIIDVSTSIPAARHLTHDVESSARRVSLFLNPKATDLVVLAEDQQRAVPLDMIEMQYYRHLLHEPALEHHLQRNDERVRYAASCRDISASIPQDLVALHAALGSRAVRTVASTEDAYATILACNPNDLTVAPYRIPLSASITHKFGEWTLYTDEWFIKKVFAARASKLPNETGGVLLGSYDMQRKIIYLADTILSPPDSQEWPTVYIRGYEGLGQELSRVARITANQLTYAGEWHSHPAGVGCRPSYDDQKAFEWLGEVMELDGLPPLMLIVGDNTQYQFYLGHMEA
jgi:hypothetical protein